MRWLVGLGFGFALLFGGCYTYEIPQPEIERIDRQIEKGKLQKVKLEDMFGKDHKFPKLEDYFFYMLYHLETSGKDYVVDRKDLETYFEKNNLSSFIPFSKIEKIVKEDGVLKMYNGKFNETIPGVSMLYMSVSENIHFDSRQEYRIHLRPVQGNLQLKPEFFMRMRLLGLNFKSEIQEIQLYDKGKKVMFKCKVTLGDLESYREIIYHSKDGTARDRELDPQEIVEKK